MSDDVNKKIKLFHEIHTLPLKLMQWECLIEYILPYITVILLQKIANNIFYRKWPITVFNVKTGNKTRACYDCPLLGGLVFYLPCVVAQIENNLA